MLYIAELESPSEEKIRWCTQSKEEKTKCDTWTIASEGAIECVEASLAEECVIKILVSKLFLLFYLKIAIANKECGLVQKIIYFLKHLEEQLLATALLWVW